MKKPTGIFYITDLLITIQTEKSVVKVITYPKDLVKEGEIVDQEAFAQFLAGEIKDVGKKLKSGVVVLGSGLLYQRSIDKDADLSKAKEELFSSVPFDQKFISEKTIETGSKIYLLATHRLFYQEVIKACDRAGIAIIAVLPFSLFSDKDVTDTVDKDVIKAILTKEELYEDGNFLSNDPPPSLEKEEDKEDEKVEEEPEDIAPASSSSTTAYRNVQVWNTPRLVMVLGFLIALTGILGGLIYLQTNHFELPGEVAQVTSTPEATPTPTEVPKQVAKSDLKVLVQNGTGTAGQAGKVKTIFEEAGYTSVETGNADSSDNERTEVVFSSSVSKTDQQEIKDLLLKTFSAVTTSVDTNSTVDIIIITGQEK